MTISQIIYDQAALDIGTYEWAGEDHNPKVLAYYAKAGHPEIKNDEVPWCAAYVGAKLAEVGLIGTGSLLARSYEKWGVRVPVSQARPGDIVILSRGEPWQGHVGFVSKIEGGWVHILGGNQGNQVNVTDYKAKRIAAIRRAKAPRTTALKSTTMQAVGVTAASGVSGAAAVLGKLDPTAQYMVLAFCGVALLGLGWIARERLRKWGEGAR